MNLDWDFAALNPSGYAHIRAGGAHARHHRKQVSFLKNCKVETFL